MKKLNKSILLLVLFTTVITLCISVGCKSCGNDAPRARIINNGTEKASVQIKTSGGNTTNVNNVERNTSSPYVSYAAGEVTFTVSIKTSTLVKVVDMATCYDYDITIDGSNNISTTTINRN